MDSELKNINKVDTKCSLQLFKVHPKDSNSTLYENSDLLVKDYKEMEKQYGYTWENFNQYNLFDSFQKCEEKNIPECNLKNNSEEKLFQNNDKIVKHCSIIQQQQKSNLENKKMMLKI